MLKPEDDVINLYSFQSFGRWFL